MIELGLSLDQFELDVATQRAEEMVGLCGYGLGWRPFKRGILFERLVIRLHVPPFAVDCGQAVIGQRRIA